jgi:hypothetical protein
MGDADSDRPIKRCAIGASLAARDDLQNHGNSFGGVKNGLQLNGIPRLSTHLRGAMSPARRFLRSSGISEFGRVAFVEFGNNVRGAIFVLFLAMSVFVSHGSASIVEADAFKRLVVRHRANDDLDVLLSGDS